MAEPSPSKYKHLYQSLLHLEKGKIESSYGSSSNES